VGGFGGTTNYVEEEGFREDNKKVGRTHKRLGEGVLPGKARGNKTDLRRPT